MSENEKPIGEFMAAAQGVAALVEEKNKAYGNSFDQAGDFLKLLYPQGLKPEQFHDALTLVRMFDKMKRIATNPAAFGEDPYKDLMGYAILAVARNERNKHMRPHWLRQTKSDNGPLQDLIKSCGSCGNYGIHCGGCTGGPQWQNWTPKVETNKPQAPMIAAQRATGINETSPKAEVKIASIFASCAECFQHNLVQYDSKKIDALNLTPAIMGHVVEKRSFGDLAFLRVRDDSGEILVSCEKSCHDEAELSSVIHVYGTLYVSQSGELAIQARCVWKL